MQSIRGQAAHGADQQDRQIGRQRASDPVAQRHPAGSVDTAERATRPARVASVAHLSGQTAYASQESNPRYVISPHQAGLYGGFQWRNPLSHRLDLAESL